MLRPQLHKANLTKLLTGVPSTLGDGHSFMSLQRAPVLRFRRSTSTAGRISASSARNSPLVSAPNENKTISVSAEVTVKLTVGGVLSNIGLSHGLDDIADLFGKSILLELVSSELDPKTGLEKGTIKGFAHKVSEKDGEVKYEATFEVSDDFGEVGGIFVTNEHHKEMHLKAITLTGFPFGPVAFGCNSWVQPKSVSSEKRIFFTNKSYLPSQTPSGLKRLREKELGNLRGNGQGERKASDRIYDYDTYNDLGNPDKSEDLKRPVLGGKEFPYPRRGRTGRPRSKKDPMSETRSGSVYVPRDEAFSEVKGLTFSARTFKSVLHAVVPSLETLLVDKDLGFPIFRAIDSLFDEGLNIPKPKDEGIFKLALPRIIKALEHGEESLMQFELPELLQRDKFSWFKDEEFARQTLAGLNPLSIQLVKEFPIKSKLDPEVYGPADSLITKELIEREIKGIMTLEEAIKAKKVFVIDYHDLFLPYVHKVRAQRGTTLYGSRALFFLTEDSTLRPIAIELTRPKSNTEPQWRQVFTPGYDATSCWLWKIAKAHVVAHDAGYHQLVSHWLRTHCCIEPFIIAANRQLSAMHPIYRLLHPHFRYTMEINALAREALINAGGIIESSFSPLKYSIEISSVIYGKLWRFDKQSLPADLISRGMAVEDPTAEHGLKLAIEDYPYANDGLLMWSAIKDWITEYVSHYYQDASAVASDSELQSWWTEARNKGHPDIKDGWLPLDTPADLVHILSTIIWVASCHHAAVNFGQYSFGGYFPNRPTIVRTNVPTEDHEEGSEGYFRFLQRPESALLQSFPSQVQATVVMAILDVLSSHSPDEEYIGDEAEGAWGEDPVVAAAFEKFNGRLKEIEGIIDGRNTDWRLKNRTGAGIVPYNLLKPFSEPGITGRGVPNSISI